MRAAESERRRRGDRFEQVFYLVAIVSYIAWLVTADDSWGTMGAFALGIAAAHRLGRLHGSD